MQLLGDFEWIEAPRSALTLLRSERWLQPASPIKRHESVCNALLRGGELTQGLLDEEFRRAGMDDLTPLSRAAHRLVSSLAALFLDSLSSPGPEWKGVEKSRREKLQENFEALLRLPLPERILCRRAEGFAFYGLYPECYVAAAEELAPECGGRAAVIGVRSIGTVLAPLVAARLGPNVPVWTVRPGGDPFQRTLRIGPALERDILACGRARRYLLVDEGPGYSGTSLSCIAQWLNERGVSRENVVFLPSHSGLPSLQGPGLDWWKSTRRVCHDFENLRNEGRYWALPFSGDRGVVDLSAGAWRTFLAPDESPSDQLLINPRQERRKLLLQQGSKPVLARFAGLGVSGEFASLKARRLSEAGFIPEHLGHQYGFLLQPWLRGARPLRPNRLLDPILRASLLSRVGAYLQFIERALETDPTHGAPLDFVYERSLGIVREYLGVEAGRQFAAWEPLLPVMTGAGRVFMGDHKMQLWEWLETEDGRIVKTDALDHWNAHHPLGAQPLEWDLAAAEFEFGFFGGELEALRSKLTGICPVRLAFFREVYPAIQAAFSETAAALIGAAPDGAPSPEGARHLRRREACLRKLSALLGE